MTSTPPPTRAATVPGKKEERPVEIPHTPEQVIQIALAEIQLMLTSGGLFNQEQSDHLMDVLERCLDWQVLNPGLLQLEFTTVAQCLKGIDATEKGDLLDRLHSALQTLEASARKDTQKKQKLKLKDLRRATDEMFKDRQIEEKNYEIGQLKKMNSHLFSLVPKDKLRFAGTEPLLETSRWDGIKSLMMPWDAYEVMKRREQKMDEMAVQYQTLLDGQVSKYEELKRELSRAKVTLRRCLSKASAGTVQGTLSHSPRSSFSSDSTDASDVGKSFTADGSTELIRDLHGQLASAQKTIEAVEKKNEQLARDLVALQTTVSVSEGRNEELKKELATVREQTRQTPEKVTKEVQRENESLRKQIEDLISELAAVRSNLDDKQTELMEVHANHKLIEDALETLRQETQRCQQAKKELEERFAVMLDDLGDGTDTSATNDAFATPGGFGPEFPVPKDNSDLANALRRLYKYELEANRAHEKTQHESEKDTLKFSREILDQWKVAFKENKDLKKQILELESVRHELSETQTMIAFKSAEVERLTSDHESLKVEFEEYRSNVAETLDLAHAQYSQLFTCTQNLNEAEKRIDRQILEMREFLQTASALSSFLRMQLLPLVRIARIEKRDLKREDAEQVMQYLRGDATGEPIANILQLVENLENKFRDLRG